MILGYHFRLIPSIKIRRQLWQPLSSNLNSSCLIPPNARLLFLFTTTNYFYIMARRVRTGCVTCRKRRVKCDERRPACERCRNANFECEGFEAPRKISSLARRDSSSPEASSPERVLELPWRQSTWRPNQLPLYHHFITSTVVRLFRVDHVSFWRDRVAQMSFNIESVYEALLAVGAAHRAILLSCSGDNRKEIMRCKVLGFGAYGRTLRLLATNMSRDTANDPWPVLIVLVLCTYFEV